MTSLCDAAQQALEALSCLEYDFCGITDGPSDDTTEAAITALRAALAEQYPDSKHATIAQWRADKQRKPLTEEELSKIIDAEIGFNSCCGWEETFARAIEAAHGIKDA